jgi:hypothetical protein
MTATGVVDFAAPSMEAAYPDGYSWIDIGNRSWQTIWPPKTGGANWELSKSPTEPPHTSAAQLQLGEALKADTGPAALLAALRSGTQRVTRLGAPNSGRSACCPFPSQRRQGMESGCLGGQGTARPG